MSDHDIDFDPISLCVKYRLVILPGDLVLLGDFNFHIDDPNDSEAKRFLEKIGAFDFTQHIRERTHKNGHTLDLVLTRSSDDIVQNFLVTDPLISDHSAVHFNLLSSKPSLTSKVITYRQWKSVDIDAFKTDITWSDLSSFTSNDPSKLVQKYNTVLCDLVEKYAPLKVKEVTIRPSAPWYTSDIDIQKRKLRMVN